MKQITKMFIFLAVLILCLSGCSSLTGSLSSAPPSSQQSESDSSHTTSETISEAPSSTASIPSIEEYYQTHVEPLMFLRNIKLQSPSDIPASMFYGWYLTYINNNTPSETRNEKYKIDGIDGWTYPAEEYETNIQKYFDVSQDHLRKGNVYHSEGNYYNFLGSGFPMFSKIEKEDDISINGNEIKMLIACSNSNDFTETIQKELTVQKLENGFKYKSLITIE